MHPNNSMATIIFSINIANDCNIDSINKKYDTAIKIDKMHTSYHPILIDKHYNVTLTFLMNCLSYNIIMIITKHQM